MNTDTNELVDGNTLKELFTEEAKNFEPVPPWLDRAAKQALAGKSRTFVSKTSGGKLSKWAAKKRKAKRKAQKAARKKNR